MQLQELQPVIEIFPSQAIETRKEGKNGDMFFQSGYIKLPGEEMPRLVQFGVSREQRFYGAGQYMISINSFRPGRFDRLELAFNIDLIKVDQKQAKAS